ncbi:hypothetical protein CANCADRAFT_43301 [Tortispora caseinolytica NRRL Y-17796]|uniref:Uncharacterized protein n=1 Tax=Tortispora caseinolytica NRRL Y-17796 TaxID=767744 RepID=A0A1E4TLT1_9ASCO|nr:hypothetical protein CANCADRAFT_43301 [Tortispora caseinolytica NRRL Y-17796]
MKIGVVVLSGAVFAFADKTSIGIDAVQAVAAFAEGIEMVDGDLSAIGAVGVGGTRRRHRSKAAQLGNSTIKEFGTTLKGALDLEACQRYYSLVGETKAKYQDVILDADDYADLMDPLSVFMNDCHKISMSHGQNEATINRVIEAAFENSIRFL